MMFRSSRGKIKVSLGEDETELLRMLVAEYQELLEAEHPPGDPVMDRLFPSASLDDDEVDRKFRDLSLEDLGKHKKETVQTALACLGEAGPWSQTLSPEESESWLVLLTDIRLAIGARCEVTEEKMNLPVDPTDPVQWQMAVLHYLGSLQESLVGALST